MNILQPGTYILTHRYVQNTYILSSDGYAEVFTTATLHNPAALLKVISAAELEARLDARCKFSPFTFTAAPVATIGKARAYKLHKIMGRLGIVNHYKAAGKALQREVASLAALTLKEAAQVWGYLLNHFPQARQIILPAAV